METTSVQINPTNFPAAWAAMDAAAREFWAYPDTDWQDEFLRQWALQNDCTLLLSSLS